MARYRNPWYREGQYNHGPEFYETEARPVRHADCLIYQRIRGACWDVVRDEVCVAQRAGLEGAKRAAESASLWNGESRL